MLSGGRNYVGTEVTSSNSLTIAYATIFYDILKGIFSNTFLVARLVVSYMIVLIQQCGINVHNVQTFSVFLTQYIVEFCTVR